MSSAPSSSHMALGDLVELTQTSGTASNGGNGAQTHTLPSFDGILSSLGTRFKGELPYINCGHDVLVAINPQRPLASLSDASAQAYIERIIGDDAGDDEDDNEDGPTSPRAKRKREKLQPHPYEFACRIHLSMQRTGKSQAVVFR